MAIKQPTAKARENIPPKGGKKGTSPPGSGTGKNPPGKSGQKKRKTITPGPVARTAVVATTIPNVAFNAVAVVSAQLPTPLKIVTDLDESLAGLVGLSSPVRDSFSTAAGIKPEAIVGQFYTVTSGMVQSWIEAAKKSENSSVREVGFVSEAVGSTITSATRPTLGQQPVLPQFQGFSIFNQKTR